MAPPKSGFRWKHRSFLLTHERLIKRKGSRCSVLRPPKPHYWRRSLEPRKFDDRRPSTAETGMNCRWRRIREYLDGPGLAGLTTAGALLGSAGIAHSGPCTAQIAQVEQQVGATAPGPQTGPTGPQTL